MDDNYQDLANTVIVRAAKDYRKALQEVSHAPGSPNGKKRMVELEGFFHSEYYKLLTNLDGDMLIQKLRQEVLG